jgi:hypothetical protein
MSESGSSPESSLAEPVAQVGADAGTRDALGSRYGGEKLGKHPTPLVWFLMFVIVVGVSVAGVAIIFDSLWVFIAGVVVAAVGGIASLAAGVMNMTE